MATSKTKLAWIKNPTECVWDVDDSAPGEASNSYLAPGATVTDKRCVIADSMQHLAGVWLTSTSP